MSPSDTQALPRKERRLTGTGAVKLSSDCWRTINGAHYEAWMSFPSAGRIAAYRAAGVRCRRFGEELFVHTLDTDQASSIDKIEEEAGHAAHG